ncbi:MAG: hypothetical protein R3D25_03180 [Geminicoccaceae bacterium]
MAAEMLGRQGALCRDLRAHADGRPQAPDGRQGGLNLTHGEP